VAGEKMKPALRPDNNEPLYLCVFPHGAQSGCQLERYPLTRAIVDVSGCLDATSAALNSGAGRRGNSRLAWWTGW
jgi:hypothetical protein